MDWNAGYVSDIEYTAGFYREQNPTYLNYVCILNGFEPVPLDRPYTYFELGFGRGLTVTVQAASNPQGRFYATDFNAAHVAGAQQLADAAGLDNLTLMENSFSDLAEGKVADLPQFDFITLHGIYSWVSPENRQHIRNFIARYLKPGGIVFLSYNSMPGWATAAPMQRLLLENAKANPNRSNVQIEQGRDFIAKLMDLKAGYFEQNPNVSVRWQAIKTGNTNYLVHEYMNDFWEPLYHADVARGLGEAKLDFVGSAEIPYSFPVLYLSQEKQDMLKAIPEVALRETIRDFLMNTSFRKDVFIRGARTMSHTRYLECLSHLGVALLIPRDQVSLKIKMAIGEINAREELYMPLIDALVQRPHSITEILAMYAAKGHTLATVVQVVSILAASNQTAIYSLSNAERSSQSSQALNRALTREVHFGDDFQVLSSSLLGNGLQTSTMELLVYHQLTATGKPIGQPAQIDTGAIAKAVWKIMAAQGRRLLKEGKPIEGEEANVAEVTRMTTRILASKLPLWQQLNML